jgi:hypothetical protein
MRILVAVEPVDFRRGIDGLAAVCRQVLNAEAQRSPPLHMCDGLARNAPKGHATVDCQCNVHARRGFVEVEGSFPEECQKVVASFSVIYRVEAQAKAAGLNAQERLRAHQTESQPVMENLRSWFAELIETKHVEPNSGLGAAIRTVRPFGLRIALLRQEKNPDAIPIRRPCPTYARLPQGHNLLLRTFALSRFPRDLSLAHSDGKGGRRQGEGMNFRPLPFRLFTSISRFPAFCLSGLLNPCFILSFFYSGLTYTMSIVSTSHTVNKTR